MDSRFHGNDRRRRGSGPIIPTRLPVIPASLHVVPEARLRRHSLGLPRRHSRARGRAKSLRNSSQILLFSGATKEYDYLEAGCRRQARKKEVKTYVTSAVSSCSMLMSFITRFML